MWEYRQCWKCLFLFLFFFFKWIRSKTAITIYYYQLKLRWKPNWLTLLCEKLQWIKLQNNNAYQYHQERIWVGVLIDVHSIKVEESQLMAYFDRFVFFFLFYLAANLDFILLFTSCMQKISKVTRSFVSKNLVKL